MTEPRHPFYTSRELRPYMVKILNIYLDYPIESSQKVTQRVTNSSTALCYSNFKYKALKPSWIDLCFSPFIRGLNLAFIALSTILTVH